jgi:hypothetical protein
MDELEPAPDTFFHTTMRLEQEVDELCAESATYDRVPELADVADDREEGDWVKFLVDLEDADSGLVDMEDQQSGEGYGFIRDTHGGVMFVPYC